MARSEADSFLDSILSHYSGFNQEGREKLADLADGLAASGKHIKTTLPDLVAENKQKTAPAPPLAIPMLLSNFISAFNSYMGDDQIWVS